MSQSGPKSFSLKTGNCYIYPDRIEIQRADIQGKFFSFMEQRGIHGAYVYYVITFLGLIGATFLTTLIDNYFLAFFFALSSLGALYGLWVNRQISFAQIIPRAQIESVDYAPAVEGVSRATLSILFRPKKRLFKRKLILPNATLQGTSLADTAYWMMREEGLIQASSKS